MFLTHLFDYEIHLCEHVHSNKMVQIRVMKLIGTILLVNLLMGCLFIGFR